MIRVVKVGRESVPVSEEVYREYYRLARRERYMERDIKVGRIEADSIGETVVFMPVKRIPSTGWKAGSRIPMLISKVIHIGRGLD